MNDPYKVLGVPQNASDAQIKEAYRELAKKYHPDKYINNPLADLAAEKMREINEAYDYLTKNKSVRACAWCWFIWWSVCKHQAYDKRK